MLALRNAAETSAPGTNTVPVIGALRQDIHSAGITSHGPRMPRVSIPVDGQPENEAMKSNHCEDCWRPGQDETANTYVIEIAV